MARITFRGVVQRLRHMARQLRGAYRARSRPRVISHHGIRLPIHDALSEEMRGVLYAGAYEEREYQVLRQLLRQGDRVLELGSGLGFVTVLCAKACGSAAVTSVEANPQMLPRLEETFRCNGVTPKLIAGMVAAQAGRGTFYVNDNFWSSSTYDRGGSRIDVPGLAFEQLVDAHRPTVIVMDIEGGETALTSLRIDSCVRAVVVELHAAVTGVPEAESVRSWFAREGFVATSDWGNRSVVVYERGT